VPQQLLTKKMEKGDNRVLGVWVKIWHLMGEGLTRDRGVFGSQFYSSMAREEKNHPILIRKVEGGFRVQLIKRCVKSCGKTV